MRSLVRRVGLDRFWESGSKVILNVLVSNTALL
jgi:hypothetical protein